MSEKTLNTMYGEAVAAAADVVAAMNEHKNQKEIKELKKTCTTKTNLYNSHLADEYYRSLAAEYGTDAVKVAIEHTENSVPKAIGFQFKTTDDGLSFVNQTEPIVKIDLARMDEVIGKEYFHDDEWFKRVNALALLMAKALNKELGGNDSFQYAIDEAAREFDISAEADPTSASSMTKAFQRVVDGILWVGNSTDKKGNPVNNIKFTSAHWAYIRECMSRKGAKNGEVIYSSPAGCLDLVTNTINMILNNIGNKLSC